MVHGKLSDIVTALAFVDSVRNFSLAGAANSAGAEEVAQGRNVDFENLAVLARIGRGATVIWVPMSAVGRISLWWKSADAVQIVAWMST